jgi:hypothetical protein
MRKFECAARRQVWLHAQTLACMPDDAARRTYMLSIAKSERRNLGRAAQILIEEGRDLLGDAL